LIEGRLDFLETEDIRLLALDEFVKLRLARTDAVDVPGCDFEHADIIRIQC
jgi:hypothetical protein